jgi:hypothetical protein
MKTRFMRLCAWCALLGLALAALSSTGVAQPQPQEQPVLLFSADRNVPKPVQLRLIELFSKLGQVASDSRYRLEARKQQMSPAVEDTITLLLPFEGVTLGIFVETFQRDRSRYLRVRYFDGLTGQPLLKDEVPLEGGKLKPVYEYFLPARARRALESLGAAQNVPPLVAVTPPAPSEPGTPEGPVAEPPPVEEPKHYEPPPAWSESDAEATEGDEPFPITAWGSVGLGVSMQSSELPTDQGPAGVDGGASAALDVALNVESTGDQLRMGARIDYRSSIGYELTETPLGGVARESPARSHEFLASLLMRFRFDATPEAMSIAVTAGWMHQDFRTDVELHSVPPYGAGGPKLGVGFDLPIGERFRLALGPEIGWLVALDDEAKAMGLQPGGPAFGGDVELFVKIGGHFGVRLHYRELALRLPTVYDAGAYRESRRFITLSGLVAY